MNWRQGGLYLISRETEDLATLVAECEVALAGRPALLQYRSKLTERALRRQQAIALLQLCRRLAVPFIVNDDLELALEIDADGVHLGRDDGAVETARRRLGAQRILGITCYDEFDRALAAERAGADYVAFGAVYPSPTKPNAVHAPLQLVARAARDLTVPVAVIGGITLENAPPLVAAGARLLAVVSDVFEHAEPGRRAGDYARLFESGSGSGTHIRTP